MSDLLHTRLAQDALLYASAAHAATGHRRPPGRATSIASQRAIAEAVAKASGATPEGVAAAYLHNVIGETHVTADDLIQVFPSEVVALVLALTDPVWRSGETVEAYRENLLEYYSLAPAEAQTIKCIEILNKCTPLVEGRLEEAQAYLKQKQDQLSVLHEADPQYRSRAIKLVSRGLPAMA